MVLSDQDIVRYQEMGKIQNHSSPDLTKQLGSCSIDFRLGNTFRLFEHSKYPYIDLREEIDLNELMHKMGSPRW